VEQPNGNPCPQCGAPRNRDNTPSCGCTLRAADALRDARTADAAAAEDFDPLRIRPYVELDAGTAAGTPGEAQDGARETPARDAPGAGDAAARPESPHEAAETMPLRAVPPEAPGTRTSGAGDATSVLPMPLAPPTTEPSATDLHLFEAGRPRPSGDGPAPQDTAAPAAVPRRRRRGAALAVAGALVAVVGAAGWASGLFSYETPSRDTALPRDIRAGVPDPSSGSPSAAPSPSASSAAPASASASPSASASAGPSDSASPSASSAAPNTSRPAEPSAAPTATAAPTASPDGAQEAQPDGAGPVLRRGDRGPEVAELQLRLRQLYLYNDEITGQFTHRVEEALRNYQWSRGLQDELSAYGPQTRTRLESETREP
jgi:hypothetical protein